AGEAVARAGAGTASHRNVEVRRRSPTQVDVHPSAECVAGLPGSAPEPALVVVDACCPPGEAGDADLVQAQVVAVDRNEGGPRGRVEREVALRERGGRLIRSQAVAHPQVAAAATAVG